MAQVMLPYLQVYKVRGKQFAYYRRAGKRVRLAGEIGSPEFLAAYKIASEEVSPKIGIPSKAAPGTFQALWDAYERSPDYKQIDIETQKDYARLLKPSLALHGHRQVAGIHQAWVLAERDKRAKSPSRANRFVSVLRLLINWGIPRGFRPKDGNPTFGIKALRVGKGHRIWTDAEVELMTSERAGTVALPVLMARYLGQRLQDIIPLTWTAYDGQFITVTQRKSEHTDEVVKLELPVHPTLKRALDTAKALRDAAGTPAVTICIRPDGKPWQLSHFKHTFTETRRALELPEDMHFHGLRGTAATALAEKGASTRQIRSITGHKTDAMANKYTKQAQQKIVAKTVVSMLRPNRKRTKRV